MQFKGEKQYVAYIGFICFDYSSGRLIQTVCRCIGYDCVHRNMTAQGKYTSHYTPRCRSPVTGHHKNLD